MTTSAMAEHVCWSYDDRRDLDAYARSYLGSGLAQGEQVWYVPGDQPGPVADWLLDRGRDGRAGAVRVLPITEAYPTGQVTDPAGQVAAYVSATERAVAAGFTGLRVFADPTPLVRTPAQLDAFARYEYAIGGFMRVGPMRAVCAYDRAELGDRAVAELACVHEESNDPVSFHLIAGTPPAMAVLSGELDWSVEELFVAALDRSELGRSEPGRSGGEVLVDGRGLRFIDHRGLLHLERHARERAVTVVLRTSSASTGRLADLLGLSHVRVEIAA